MDLAFSTNDNFAADDVMSRRQGNCRRCRNATDLMCMRCGDCYCSRKCQEIDWPEHRYICFPKPALVKLSSVPTDENIPEFGAIEPVHLKEQLRIMANVCRDFMKQLDAQLNGSSKVTSDNATKHINNNLAATNSRQQQQQEKRQQQQRNSQESNKPLTNGYMYADNDSSSTTSSKNDDKKPADALVKLTGMRTSNRVGLCPQKFFQSHNQILERISNYGRTAPALIYPPQQNTFVTTQKQMGSACFVRAKVLQPKFADRIRVEFVDFGYTVQRQFHELRQITKDLAELPIYVKLFDLKHVGLHNFNKETSQITSFFDGKILKMIKADKGDAVELYDSKTGVNYNNRIEDWFKNGFNNNNNNSNSNTSSGSGSNTITPKHLTDNRQEHSNRNEPPTEVVASSSASVKKAQAVSPKNTTPTSSVVAASSSRVLKPPFAEHIFSKNTRNAPAIILDTSAAEEGYIACILQNDFENLQKIQTYLTDRMENSNEPYTPVLNEYVVAKFDGGWYRGKVVNVSSDGKSFDISYIDFLNESTLTRADIRRYPTELNYDCYTTLCLLSGLPKEISKELKEFLTSMLIDYEVIRIDRVVDIVDGSIALVESDEILQIMRKKELI